MDGLINDACSACNCGKQKDENASGQIRQFWGALQGQRGVKRGGCLDHPAITQQEVGEEIVQEGSK